MTYTLHIRRGILVNTDPQRRCYNGQHNSSRVDWGEWEPWFMSYPTREDAERAVRLFQREDQQFKIVEVNHETLNR